MYADNCTHQLEKTVAKGFLMFSEGIDRQHQAVMGYDPVLSIFDALRNSVPFA